ncbi:hypothetical protein RIF29_19308 [Crotalaria pallida]|uniref:Uncharacterized protein n=1 Tax=Crotalaria pallida TaxID=3830 RepID=A0AAN9F7K7_CROPI
MNALTSKQSTKENTSHSKFQKTIMEWSSSNGSIISCAAAKKNETQVLNRCLSLAVSDTGPSTAHSLAFSAALYLQLLESELPFTVMYFSTLKFKSSV